MYQTGDLIVYGGNGVCRVESIETDGKDRRRYYTLQPLYQSCQILTPVDNPKVFIRPIISKDEAEEIIRQIPQIQPQPFYTRTPRELSEHYEAQLKTYDCRTLVTMIMSIYRKRQETQSNRRRLGVVDENYYRRAQELLHCELAAALEIPKEQVPEYIASRVELAEGIMG
ncbi:MAG: hypothetical protein E7459_01600 [Ruminococcaceae bacterium]|nr:hypothetical protein [Oscillospiraceae bacterium]